MKKILVTKAGTEITYINGVAKNHNDEEIYGIALSLINKGYDVTVCVSKRTTGMFPFKTVKIDELTQDYDEVFLQVLKSSHFGGWASTGDFYTFKFLAKFKGKVGLYYTDFEEKREKHITLLKSFYTRFFTGDSLKVEDWQREQLLEEFTVEEVKEAVERYEFDNVKLWVCYPKMTRENGGEVEFIDSWRQQMFFHRNANLPVKLFEDSHEDLINKVQYIGMAKPNRIKELETIISWENLDVHGKMQEALNPEMKKKRQLTVEQIMAIYDKYTCTYGMVNEKQYNSGVNHRHLQALAHMKPCIILAKSDENRTLYHNKELSDLLYVENKDDVSKVLQYLSDETRYNYIVKLIKEELEISKQENEQQYINRITK